MPNCGAWNQMEEIVEKVAHPKHGVKQTKAAGKVQKLNSVKHEATLDYLQNQRNLTVF